jgi:hypothetical protein
MSDNINTVDELLSDPMVLLVMERDRVQPEELRMLFERVRERAALINDPYVPAAHVVAKTCPQQWLCG